MMLLSGKVLLVAFIIGLKWLQLEAITLDQALLDDMFVSSSNLCNGTGGGTTSFNFNFSWSNVTSKWYAPNAKYEIYTFLAEMKHTEPNQNRTWKIRIGTGGNIYSYVNILGEVMPPQYHANGAFVDEVWQTVAVNGAKNTNPSKWFIHQAGVYQNEYSLQQTPFFSPNLAKYCSGRQCSFVSWGSQAHVPTKSVSHLLYYTRYKDCGDGVLEITFGFHNFGPVSDPSAYVDFLNAPWGGVRQSVYGDVLNANKNNNANLVGNGSTIIYPLNQYGLGTVYTLKKLGGYTIFAQNLPKTLPVSVFSNPCGTGSGSIVACTTTGAIQVKHTISKSNPCSYSAAHTATYNLYTVNCNIMSTVKITTGCSSGTSNCQFTFSNGRGGSIKVNGVLFWSWLAGSQYQLWFWPIVATVDTINAMFTFNDTIRITYTPATYIPVQSNMGLSFVYGTDGIMTGSRTWSTANSVMRLGYAGAIATRNYVVFELIPIQTVKITQGQTYFKRHYVATNRYVDLDAQSAKFSSEAQHSLKWTGDQVGREVILYSSNPLSFRADLTENISPSLLSMITIRCRGNTTPQPGKYPLFAMTCADKSYVGSNPYFFTPNASAINGTNSQKILRPYICNGQTKIRATWKLLGYFVPNVCAYLINATYDRTNTVMPTSTPTVSPTILPTSLTSYPTAYPTAEPSSPTSLSTVTPTIIPTSPTVIPSACPTNTPTAPPSVSPTIIPTTPSVSPSDLPIATPSFPTNQPTSMPSMPTKIPTKEPSLFPTRAPSNTPTRRPSTEPTPFPTKRPSQEPTPFPTKRPTTAPTPHSPTNIPTRRPTQEPTPFPTKRPSQEPTPFPTKRPTTAPTPHSPTNIPTRRPTTEPTPFPTKRPSQEPTPFPTKRPTTAPTPHSPTNIPTRRPTTEPTPFPTKRPSQEPTPFPTKRPTTAPTPHSPTNIPTRRPSTEPTPFPTKLPKILPTVIPTRSFPTKIPTIMPSLEPTAPPSN